MKRESLASRLFNEVALYGGIPLRRCDILRAAREDLGDHADDRFGADYFALHGPAVDAEPWTLEAFRALG